MNRLEQFAHRFSKNPTAKAWLRPIWRILYKNPKARRELRKFHASAPTVLLKAKEVLDREGIFFWLDFGILLGAIREGRLLAHDSDLDISMYLKDYSPRVVKALESAGFTRCFQYEVEHGLYGLEQTYMCDDVRLDVFFYTKRATSVVCHSFKPELGLGEKETFRKYGGLLVREFPFPPLRFRRFQFLGAEFNIPEDDAAHLSAHYGESFMTPNPQWSNLDACNEVTLPPHEKIGVLKEFARL